MSTNIPTAGSERRQNLHLRNLFETAYAMVEPFFDPETGWGGHSLEHLAYRTLRENFPDLDVGEVHSLVVAAHRVYIQRHPEKSTHLRRPGEIARPQGA